MLAVLQDLDQRILGAAAKVGLDARIGQETLEGHLAPPDAEEGPHHVLAELAGELAARDQDQHLRQKGGRGAERVLASHTTCPEANQV